MDRVFHWKNEKKNKKTKELEYGWKAAFLLPEYATTGEDFCSLIGSQRPDLQAKYSWQTS